MKYYFYIIASKRNGTIYIGITSNLVRRIFQHKNKLNKDCFTAKHNIDKLVYYEVFSGIGRAIYREKQVKKWNRSWKLKLIEGFNNNWEDLYYTLF